MQIAVLSDIHGNLEALEAALTTIAQHNPVAIYCLGDIVGYGADPAACVDLAREHFTGAVRGNHDEAIASGRGLSLLPADGQKAAVFHREQLGHDQLTYLADLPLRIDRHGCTFVHATPERPEAWQRLTSFPAMQRQFQHFDTDLCFVGHTHVPSVVSDRVGVFQVRPGHRYLINVGSVGQPRDKNPRLSLSFFDTDSFMYELVRVPYDVERAAEKIIAAGLPRRLAERLRTGS